MTEYVILPRRHNSRTLLWLLRWYFGMGMMGAGLLFLSAAAYAFIFGDAPEKFQQLLGFFVPACVFLIAFYWRKVVGPGIRKEREKMDQDLQRFVGQRPR